VLALYLLSVIGYLPTDPTSFGVFLHLRRRQPLVLGFSERHARGFDGKLTAITTRYDPIGWY
jgi:hypothetical protein